MSLEIWELIVWPATLAVVVALFLILFRKPIGKKIADIRSINKDGVGMGRADPVLQTASNIAEGNLLDHIEIDKPQLLDEEEVLLTKEINKKGLGPEDTKKLLIRNLAIVRIERVHEQTYSSILGSQIRLLRKLNVSLYGIAADIVEMDYSATNEGFPDSVKDWTLDEYLRFLLDSSLILLKDNKYRITVRGQDFIVWLVKNSKIEDKAY